jgi:flagellar motor switch protein FliM
MAKGHVLDNFIDFYRQLSLSMSDEFSSTIKGNFDMKDIGCDEQTYASFLEGCPKFALFGLFHYRSRGMLILIDPQIVYSVSNRFMGGSGEIEKKPTPLFTFSETFFGKEILSLLSSNLQNKGVDIQFLRLETYPNNIHYFFSDETILTTTMKIKLNGEPIGDIRICHPEMFLEKESLL